MSLEHSGRSASLSHKSRTTIPADSILAPRADWIAVEPLDYKMSARIHVIHETKPVRGIVRAVGPGCYPKRYDSRDKHARTTMRISPAFRRTVVHVGDEVELGGIEHRGYQFQTFYHGDRLMIMVREEDVAGVLDVAA